MTFADLGFALGVAAMLALSFWLQVKSEAS